MTLGIDLRIFQVGHQYRGIGAHIVNLLREISKLNEQPSFVFFEYPDLESGRSVIEDILPRLKNYEFRETRPSTFGKSFFKREFTSFYERYVHGDAGIVDSAGIDVLMSVDFNLGVPRNKRIKKCLISYDLIPWVLSEYYLPNYSQYYERTGHKKRAIKAEIEKRLYFNKVKQANKRADLILSISEHTKHDLVRYLGIKKVKIKTVLLGIDVETKKRKYDNTIPCENFTGEKVKLFAQKENYIFFMGGADWRRRIVDLVTAFNLAKENNKKLRLVLAGYDFKSFDALSDQNIKETIESSNYSSDILFAGFITEAQKNSLYKHAVAFVFPSVYEGFGLPLLEAMSLECPSITYKNSSIPEVGGDAVIYASDANGIADGIISLQQNKHLRKKYIQAGKKQLQKFSWEKTTAETLDQITKLVNNS